MQKSRKKLFQGLLLAAVIGLSSVALAPVSAEAGMISVKQEVEMGQQTAQALEAQYGLYQDSVAQERVERIGKSLAAVCGRKDVTFSFKILNCDEVNALACPGGFVYVYKGLLDYMPSDAELAGVLGHEVGHVAKRHTVHAMEKQMLTSLLGMAAAIGAHSGAGAQAIMTMQQALFAGYSRTDERGADKEGVNNTLKAGYNPYSMLITVYKLEDLTKAGNGGSYGLFSSHPEPEERIKRVRAQLEKYAIQPTVLSTSDDTATVEENGWSFPVSQSIGGSKAVYRAYLVAGGLWTARQRGTIDPNYFVVYDNGNTADIYYDDIQIITIYNQDAYAAGYNTAGAYADSCAELLRKWAPIANASSKNKTGK